jgi:branched-chain amino acid transport system permease protein
MSYLIHILILTGIYIILTLSLNLIIGYSGLPSMGHAAFSCIGAYTSSLLALYLGLSPWYGLFFGAIAATILGIVISFPAIRLKGDYFALATFGSGIIIYSITKNWSQLTNGPVGLADIPTFSIFSFSNNWSILIIVIIYCLLTFFTISRIVNSPFGRVLRGIREDDIATQSLGKDVNKYKILVFMIGAFFAGIAGSLYAHYMTFIDPSSFSMMESMLILIMVVFGGMGSLSGSVIGAIILVLFPEILRLLGLPSYIAAPLRQMVYGLLLVILMLKYPKGLLGKYKLI